MHPTPSIAPFPHDYRFAHPSGLRTSLRLYGLVRPTGFSDNPTLQPVDIFCTPCGAGRAIRAFASRLDAELVARTMPSSGYHVLPLAQLDPTDFISKHNGWLNVFLACGFGAEPNSPYLAGNDLQSLGWFVHANTGPWVAGRCLHWGEEVTQTLLDAYQSVGMPNYNTWLNQLDHFNPEAMDDCTFTAWQALKKLKPMQQNHRALYNPKDETWRLSNAPVDIYRPL